MGQNTTDKKRSKRKLLLLDILIAELLILSDQFTKHLAITYLKHQPAYSIIDGVLEFNYLENKGVAFGLLQNQETLFLFVGIIFLSVICYTLYKAPYKKKYAVLHVLLTFLAAGAIGNMIDRIRLGYVVDFIYFVSINFPIFNVADIFVTVATVIIFFLFLFYYKEEDLSFLSFKIRKYREIK